MGSDQDVESEESTKVCAKSENICYATLTISNVNLTLSNGKIEDLLEVKIVKGCGKSSDYNNTTEYGKYSAER